MRRRGEAHYFVHRDGRVTRLLDRQRIATHAGRSMWNGRSELDELSLGIELSGYHRREPTRAQYAAVRELLRQLQSVYEIPDAHVLTHSMVAYGRPTVSIRIATAAGSAARWCWPEPTCGAGWA